MTIPCHYCGLPVAAEPHAGPVYCCYGCSLAEAITGGTDDVAPRAMMTRLGLAIFFSMNVMVFTFFLWSQDAAAPSSTATLFYDLARYICLLFTIPVILLLAGPLAADAWRELRRGRPSLSMLLIVGVLAAFLYSADSVFRTGGHVYFEVSCSLLVAVTLGKWLEASGKLQTTAALRALSSILPEQVRRLREGREESVPRQEVQIGDQLRVLPGERIPVDGFLLMEATIDEQMVTGESVPVHKSAGSPIFSGTLSLENPVQMRVTAAPDAGFIARIVAAVTTAAAAKDRFTRLAERLAQWFLPLVLLVAAATLVTRGLSGQWEQGLLSALAVVVIACPCALGLATPMAIWAAFGRAAARQVLIHHGDSFTQLARIRAICFDKTGTLTTGQINVSQCQCVDGTTPDACLVVAATLARQSTHPLSQAIVACAQLRGLDFVRNATARSQAGKGIVGSIGGSDGLALLGSERLLAEHHILIPPDLRCEPSSDRGEHGPTAWVAWEGQARGLIRFQEELRPQASSAVRELTKRGITPVMLTGDRAARARQLGTQLGMEVRAELLPEDKLTAIGALQQRFGPVAMVGDGINDAPALAAADIGIALGSGADISRDCAGVCLLTSDLSRLPWLVDLARQTVRTIRWNLVWAFAYNVVGIAIAAVGLLHPAVAAVAMVASSLLVVTNSLRLAHQSTVLSPESTVEDTSVAPVRESGLWTHDKRFADGAAL